MVSLPPKWAICLLQREKVAAKPTDEVLEKLLTNASSTINGPPSPTGEGKDVRGLRMYRTSFLVVTNARSLALTFAQQLPPRMEPFLSVAKKQTISAFYCA